MSPPSGGLPDVACLLLPLADRSGRPAHVIGALALDIWPAAAQAAGFRVIDHVVAPDGLFQRAGTARERRGAARENAAEVPVMGSPAAPPTTSLPACAEASNPPAARAAAEVAITGAGPTGGGAMGAGATATGVMGGRVMGGGVAGADQGAFAESGRPWIGAPISAVRRPRLRLISGGRRDRDTHADSGCKDG